MKRDGVCVLTNCVLYQISVISFALNSPYITHARVYMFHERRRKCVAVQNLFFFKVVLVFERVNGNYCS